MSRFTTTELAGGQVLIEGTDVRGTAGQQVVHGTQWATVKAAGNQDAALKLVDDAIAALVAPITAAIVQAKSLTAAPVLDPLFYVVDQEEVEHVFGAPRLLTKLSPDSVLLRVIEGGHDDRLIWINGNLTVTAAPVTASAAKAPYTQPHSEPVDGGVAG